ncbi:MAG: M18 family aminopeptidase [Lachnospiraceae bacterium]|nr:M18 family aminopeptidase [Lachnospiraceae bacterium]
MEKFFSFIEKSPTSYHAVENIRQRLEEEGFLSLEEKDSYLLEAGKSYYVVRNDSSLLAFKLPKNSPKGFLLMASHSDSPCFKLKEEPEAITQKSYVKFNVEKYGGMIDSTWLDRPLSMAGRVVVKEGKELKTKLINFEENLCIIPNVAIHLNREINQGFAYNAQVDLQPLWSGQEDDSLDALLKEKLGNDQEILGKDLFVYNRQSGCFLGKNKEFIGAPRIDDLECAYGTLEGFLQAKAGDYCNVYCIFDNEEVGSSTRQGADSDFLLSNLERITYSLGKREELSQMIANSFLVSADNGHGLHPNHPEKSDSKNYPLLNKGIVIKYHGNQKYTTDAYTGAVIKAICKEAEVPYQIYHNRSDIAGGSTLGNISISHASIPTADIGLAQLAMHSSFETAGSKDLEYLISFSKAFYEKEIE